MTVIEKNMELAKDTPLSAKDFTSDQEVRWCPGCGDYAILKALRGVLAKCGKKPDDVVFVSGIGCAARFPYYLSTYGFHTIHGRAPAVATGVKFTNPDLDVWVVGGDGDFLSIGGNHLIHCLRRNVDLNMIMPNNAIYGLTKGQYSPTSKTGMKTPSSPSGSVETPMNAANLALGAGARFVARSADSLQAHLTDTLLAAQANKGASFVEILQNCIVFNDGAFDEVRDKKSSADRAVEIRHGEPLVFGQDKDKGLVVDWASGTVSVKTFAPGKAPTDITCHDETNRALAGILALMEGPELPVALGVLYRQPAPHFTDQRNDKGKAAIGLDKLEEMLNSGNTWTV